MDVYNPATEELLATIDTASVADVELAVNAAREAFETTWGLNTPATARGRLLFKFADIIEANAGTSVPSSSAVSGIFSSQETLGRASKSDRTRHRAERLTDLRFPPPPSAFLFLLYAEIIVKVEAANNGKPRKWVEAELSASLGAIRFFAGAADKVAGSTIEVDDNSKQVFTRREPIGVVAHIVPWNFPLMVSASFRSDSSTGGGFGARRDDFAFLKLTSDPPFPLCSLKMWAWKIAPALASGCTVVFKTAEATPLSVLILTKLMQEVG